MDRAAASQPVEHGDGGDPEAVGKEHMGPATMWLPNLPNYQGLPWCQKTRNLKQALTRWVSRESAGPWGAWTMDLLIQQLFTEGLKSTHR